MTGLAAHTNVDLLAAQIHALHPKAACIFEESRYTELKEKTEGTGVRLLTGMELSLIHIWMCIRDRLPETKFDDGIKKTVKWYLDNREWWETILRGEYQDYYEHMYANLSLIHI